MRSGKDRRITRAVALYRNEFGREGAIDEFVRPVDVATDGARVAQRAIAAIVAHPRMETARRLYLREFLGLYADDPFLARLLLEQGRFFVHLLTMMLHVAHDPARRESWCTVGALKRCVVACGMASARQVDHLIGRLGDAGFVQVQPAPGDRRAKLLVPTPAMLAHDRQWLAVHHAPLAVLWPERDYTPALQGDPAFQIAQRREAARWVPVSMQIMVSVPETMLFFNHAGGHMVRSALLWAAMEKSDDANVAVPYAELAARFGVSRTQVRVILRGAEALGLIRTLDRGGRRVTLMPRLWSSYDEGLAGGFYLHDQVYRALA